MNIALVILHADPARGGAERYTIDLARALVGRGHAVTLVAGSLGDGIDIPHVPLRADGRSRARRYTTFLDALDAHLLDADYDIVHAMLPVRHCDVYHPHAGLAVEAVREGHRRHPSPLRRISARVATLMNRRRWAMAEVEATLLRGPRPPVVLALSEYVKRTVRTHYPDLPEARLATLFNAVDLGRFDPQRDPAARAIRTSLGVADDDVLGLFIGQDYVRKGLRETLRATDLIDDARLKLAVVGRADRSIYARQVARQGRAGRVRFVGAQGDPYPYYAAADFFVLPTRHDPCSLVVLEALAMGLPVISTRYNGACEIMGREHGFVLDDPADVGALADAMRALLDDPRRRSMAEAVRSLRPALSQDAHFDRLESIYRTARALV